MSETYTRAKELVQFLTTNQGKPVVLDRQDCSALNRCLGLLESLQAAFEEAEAEIDQLRHRDATTVAAPLER